MLNTHTEGTVLVRQGDTLFSLAHSLSVSSDELQRLNSIRYPEAISPGELLRVPSRRPQLRPQYVVKSGDTVWSLCNEHGIDAQELRDLNSLDGFTLYEGQSLRLPSPAALGASEQQIVSQSADQLVNAPPAQQSEAQRVGKPPLLRSGDKALVIQDGDTLWDISKELKLDVGSLVNANGGCTTLQPGQVFTIPKSSYLKTRTLNWGDVVPGSDDTTAPFLRSFHRTRTIADLQEDETIQKLLAAMRWVESSNMMPAPAGDGGMSIGPLQISREYHADAWAGVEDGVFNRDELYSRCQELEYSKETCLRYMQRWVPWALQYGCIDTLARSHNGGPSYYSAPKTAVYWRKVKSAMFPYNFYTNPHFLDWGQRQAAARRTGAYKNKVLRLAIDVPVGKLVGRVCAYVQKRIRADSKTRAMSS